MNYIYLIIAAAVVIALLRRFPALATRVGLLALSPLLLVAVFVACVRYLTTIVTNPKKGLRIAIGFDQLANVALNGSEDETISSRAYRAMTEKQMWGCVLCRFLDHFEKDHCEKSHGT
jgi:hypothetical protein